MVAAAALKAQWKKKRCQLLSLRVLVLVLDSAKSPEPMKGLEVPARFSPKAKPLLRVQIYEVFAVQEGGRWLQMNAHQRKTVSRKRCDCLQRRYPTGRRAPSRTEDDTDT
jgi:hypothetical protein